MRSDRRLQTRVLVVDDEPLARWGLRALLEREADLEVVGEAGNGRTAVEAILRLAPDLLFLDVSMPEMDGFEVLAQLPSEAIPDTVFVTAHDHYAVRAFEVHAIDYLLKPVAQDRLAVALERAKERRRLGKSAAVPLREIQRTAAMAAGKDGSAPVSRLAVRSTGRVSFVRVETIDWIESADYYSKLHLRSGDQLIRQSMRSLERTLDPTRFVRIHRSAIVNVDQVREIRTRRQGGHAVILRNGTQLQLSRTRRRALQALLPGSPTVR